MDGTVTVGSWVEVQDGQFRESWRVVPHLEADTMRRHISEASSLARALLGHGLGDIVQVRGPDGRRAVTVLAVDGGADA